MPKSNKKAVAILIPKDADKVSLLLEKAILSGNKAFVQMLISRGADLTRKTGIDQSNQMYPLHAVAKTGDRDLAELCISKGASVNVESDNDKMTPLHIASFYGNAAIVEYFIQNGANLEAIDSEKRTPLINALHWNPERIDNAVIPQMLVKAGAKVNCEDSQEKTPLHYAASGTDVKLVEMLIQSGAKVRFKLGNGVWLLRGPVQLLRGPA